MTSDFFDQFFEEGWTFFYKFCLSMLGIFKDKLLEEDDFSGILQHIKFKTPDRRSQNMSNSLLDTEDFGIPS